MIAGLLCTGVVLAGSSSTAGAERTQELKVTQTETGNTTVSVGANESVQQPAPGRGANTVVCNYYEATGGSTDSLEFGPIGTMEPGKYYWADCRDLANQTITARFFQFDPAEPPISAQGLALAAQSTLVLPFAEPRTNLDRSGDQLVGIETWLWVEPASWRTLTASASIPGLTATVTATPVRVTWDMGDGQPPVVCDGPGTPYDTSVPESAQSSECSHLYQVRGAYQASATILYEITWAASNGEGGTLASASRTTQFPMSVAERQAVGA